MKAAFPEYFEDWEFEISNQTVSMQFLVLLEADIGAYAARGLDVFELDFLNLFRPRRCLLGFRSISREAAHELLKVGYLRRFLRID